MIRQQIIQPKKLSFSHLFISIPQFVIRIYHRIYLKDQLNENARMIALKIKENNTSLGIPAAYLGHRYLFASIRLAIENEDNLLLLKKHIYLVDNEFQANKDYMEQDLRTPIKVLWARRNQNPLDKIAGFQLPYKPRAGKLISMITVYLKRKYENEDPLKF